MSALKKNLMIVPAVLLCACTAHYTMDDFSKVRKTDMHVHLNTTDTFLLTQAIADNFSLFTVNVDSRSDSSLAEQEQIAQYFVRNFPGRVHYLSSFSLTGWDSEGWQDSTISKIRWSVQNGASGIKIWKNIGMNFRDSNDSIVMIDNPKFDKVFELLSQHRIPVLGHLGEPRNCWLPIEQMTMLSDQDCYRRSPKYHMYLHPEIPGYERQIAARDRLLEKHPSLIFAGAHLASLEWNIDELAKWFDTYPNATVDMAGRIWYLEQQAKDNWQKVHDFMIRYHDRFMYGTDMGTRKNDEDTEGTKRYIHKIWMHDWQFLVTSDSMSTEQFKGSFRGLHLPKNIVDDIYENNAKRIFLTNTPSLL